MIEALAGGLGPRSFWRVQLDPIEAGPAAGPGSVIARVEAAEDPAGRPAGASPEPPLEPLRSVLERAGLPVPRSYGQEPGIELLEDLGDAALETFLADAGADARHALYREALELVARLQRIDPTGLPAGERRLDRELVAYKARLFVEWSLPLGLGRPAGPAERKAVEEAFAGIAARLEAAPRRLAHRDLQSRNLLRHARPGEPARLFLIDLQGAFLAPPEYDAVCLLRDSYAELCWKEVADLRDWVRPRLPDPPTADDFEERFDLVTLVRKAKDHARFVCAARTRGAAAYAAFLPATARALANAVRRASAREARLAPLAELVLSLPETTCAP